MIPRRTHSPSLFASERECNENVPRYYSLMTKGRKQLYANGTPAESAASAEKRTYEDYSITCSKVPADNLKGLRRIVVHERAVFSCGPLTRMGRAFCGALRRSGSKARVSLGAARIKLQSGPGHERGLHAPGERPDDGARYRQQAPSGSTQKWLRPFAFRALSAPILRRTIAARIPTAVCTVSVLPPQFARSRRATPSLALRWRRRT